MREMDDFKKYIKIHKDITDVTDCSRRPDRHKRKKGR